MYTMIEGVLAYSTINSAEGPIETINLNEVVDHIETDLEIMIAQKNATIKRDRLPVLEGASVLLYQLFYNLVNNALKFSKPDGPVLVSLNSSTVYNDGIAFAGLGLALCKKIVQRHHGTITASGIKDESAVFTIELPLQQFQEII